MWRGACGKLLRHVSAECPACKCAGLRGAGRAGAAPPCRGASFSRRGFCSLLSRSGPSALPASPSRQLTRPRKVKCVLPFLGAAWERRGVSESVCADAHVCRHVSGCDRGRVCDTSARHLRRGGFTDTPTTLSTLSRGLHACRSHGPPVPAAVTVPGLAQPRPAAARPPRAVASAPSLRLTVRPSPPAGRLSFLVPPRPRPPALDSHGPSGTGGPRWPQSALSPWQHAVPGLRRPLGEARAGHPPSFPGSAPAPFPPDTAEAARHFSYSSVPLGLYTSPHPLGSDLWGAASGSRPAPCVADSTGSAAERMMEAVATCAGVSRRPAGGPRPGRGLPASKALFSKTLSESKQLRRISFNQMQKQNCPVQSWGLGRPLVQLLLWA